MSKADMLVVHFPTFVMSPWIWVTPGRGAMACRSTATILASSACCSWRSFRLRTWLQLPGAAHRSTTLLTPETQQQLLKQHDSYVKAPGKPELVTWRPLGSSMAAVHKHGPVKARASWPGIFLDMGTNNWLKPFIQLWHTFGTVIKYISHYRRFHRGGFHLRTGQTPGQAAAVWRHFWLSNPPLLPDGSRCPACPWRNDPCWPLP